MKTSTFNCRHLLVFLLLLTGSRSFAQRIFATSQVSSQASLVCVNCIVANQANAVDGNLQTHSTLNVAVGVLAQTYQELIFPSVTKVAANTPVTIKLGTGDNLLDLTVLGRITLRPYNGNTPVGGAVAANTLVTALSNNNQVSLTITPTQVYDRVRVTLTGGLLGALSSIYLYDAYYLGNAPAACNTPFDELHGISAGLLNLGVDVGGVANPQNAIDGNIATASTLNSGVGAVGAYAQQTVIFQNTSTIGDSVRLTLSIPQALLDAGVLSNISVSTYNGNTSNNDSQSFNGGLVRLRLLDLSNNRQKVVVSYAPAKLFNRVQLRLGGGIANVLSTVNLFEAELVIPSPVIRVNNTPTTNAQICAGGTVAFTIAATPNTIYNWYTTAIGGTPIAGAGATFTTPVLNATTTYYVSAKRSGCTDESPRTAVAVTVNQIPAGPVITNNNITVCPGGTASFTAQTVAGVTVNWYAAATGGTPLFTGNTFTTAAINATTSYYAEAVAGGTCISPARTQVTATLGALPATPALTANNVSICPGNVAVLSVVSPVAGYVYNWYTTATGGTPVFTGVNFTTPALTASTTYYAEAVNATGCASAARIQGTVTVQPKPADPVLAANNLNLTAGQTATISVTNAQTGISYKWYTSVAAATPVFTGTTFTTPALFTNTTYYVAAVNSTGCESENRTAITIKVTINNNSPCTFANQQSPAVNGLCIGCTITNDALAADADTTTASTINVLAGLLNGYAEQQLRFQQPGFTGDTVKLVIQTPVGLADVNLLNQISVALYNGATLVGSYPLDNALIKVRLLGGGNRYAVFVPAKGNYDRMVVRLTSGVASLLTSLNIYYAIQQFPAPVFTPASPEICKGSPATINVSSPANGTFSWYTAPTGGAAVFTGANFTTPPLTANDTYYIEYTRTGGCVAPVRYPVQILVNDPPAKPVLLPANAAIFSGQKASFTAQAGANVTVKWYTTPTGGTSIFTGNTFTTPALTANTTYYAESSIGNCVSPDRTPAPVVVAPLVIPDVAVNPPAQTVNPGTSATLTASSTTPGAVFNWYTTVTGGTSIFTGPTFNTPSVFGNVTYYAEATIPATGAVSATRAAGAITVSSSPNSPVACNPAIAETNTTSGLLCVLCGISNVNGSVDNDRNTFSQLATPVGLIGGYSQQTLRFANIGRAGDSVIVELGIPGSLASVGVLSQISLATYNGATYNNDRFNLNGAAIAISLLNGTSRFRAAFKATADFDRVEIRLNSGLAGVLNALNIYDASQAVAAPVIAAATVTACQGTQSTLTATVPAHVTVKWYTSATGGTPVFTGAVFNTPVLNASTTYYAEASRTADGCTQTVRTLVKVNITPTPAAPIVNTPTVTVCAGQPATFTAQAVNGVTFSWYSAATGGTPVFTGASFSPPALTATTNYYVEANGTGSCGSSTRTQVTANVTSTPLVPVVSQATTQTCSGSTAVLTATSTQPGVTFNWYTAATGGTPVFTGAQYTTPQLTANTSYYVEAANGTCISPTRAQANVTVNPVPAAPTVTVTPSGGNITSGQSATLQAASTTAGATFRWYTTATGGSPVSTSATFITPALTSNTTYYVESLLAGSGCTSPTRTAVSINVTPVFSTSCDFASSQVPDINGLCVGCVIGNPTNAIDADTTTASQINVPISLLGAYAAQRLIFGDAGSVGDTVRVKISVPAGLLSASVLSQLQIASYNGGTYNGDRVSLTSSLVRIQLLAGGTTALVKFAPGAAYDRVEVRLNSIVASALNSLNVFFASKQINAPALAASTVNICAGGTATFSVSNPNPNATYKWYTAATGGTAIFTGTTYTTGALSATTTYYVEAVRTSNNCVNPNRVAATVNVTPSPVNPVLNLTGTQICAGDNVTLTVTNAAGATVRWYNAATGGTLLFTGSSFIVSPVSTTNYFAEITNGACSSPARTQATITVNPRPAKPGLVLANVQVCAGSTATLQVQTPETGVSYNWYTAATGGTAVFTGTSFVTPVITTNTTYYAEAANPVTACTNNGGRTPATITVNGQLNAPVLSASNTQVCAGGSATISVSNPVAGIQYNWFTAATGGALVFTGTTFTVNNLTANVSYYVEAAANGCTSATRTQTNITVLPVPTAPQIDVSAGGSLNVCAGSSAILRIANPQADLVYRWYSAAVNGALLFTGAEYTTPALTSNTTYYVEASSAGNCNPSARTSVTVTINALPDDPVLASSTVTVCAGGAATLTVSAPQAGISYRWYDSPLQTNLLFTGTTYITGPVTSTANFYVSAVNANGCSSNNLAQAQVSVQQAPGAPSIINGNNVASCSGAQVTLNIEGPQAGYTYKWYTVATGGTPVFTGTSFTTSAISSTTMYYVEAANQNGCTSLTRTVVTVTVSTVPDNPQIDLSANGGSINVCTGSAATISISSPQAGLTYNWYNAATNGTLVFTGTQYTTPALSNTTNYYIEAVNAAGCKSAARTMVTVTVNTTPNDPTVASSAVNVCSGSSATLTVTAPQAGISYQWYDSAAQTNLLFTGTTFITGPISATTNFYVRAFNGTGCSSVNSTMVQVTTQPAPDAPLITNGNSAISCAGAQTTLSIANPQTGYTYRWYTVANGGTPVFAGVSFVTPALSGSTTYYAEAVNQNGCASVSRTSISITVSPQPSAPAVSTAGLSVCAGSSATLTATGSQANTTISWFANATGGNALFTGTTFTTPVINASATYYAEAANTQTGCSSATRTAVTVTLLGPLPAPVVSVSNTTSSSVSFSWAAVAGATGYEVSSDNGATYSAPTAGNNGLFTLIAGLQPGQKVTIVVRALGALPCQLSANSDAVTGTANNPLGNGIFVPNAFTPNGDGNNDVMMIYGTNISSATFSVYDQWGELQFRSTNKSSGWDGTYKGTAQPAGVYVYFLEAKMNDGQVVKKKGTITLLR